MKNRKYAIISIIVSILLCVKTPGIAQVTFNGQITFQPYELKQKGDSLYVRMDVQVKNFRIEKDRSLALVPVLTTGSQEHCFPEILIHGTIRHKIYERQQAFRKDIPQQPAYQVIRSNPQQHFTLPYQIAIPFEDWMADAQLDLKEELCGCGSYMHQISIEHLVDKVTLEKLPFYEVQPLVAYIKPPVEAVKTRSEQQEAFLDFPVGKTQILPEFGNNPAELAKIERMIADLRREQNLTVDQVSIIGYASPEGSATLNDKLARGRAEALKSYLTARSGFPVHLYRIEQAGEDWTGLVSLLENSNLPYKQEAISIIHSTYYPEEWKRRLQALKGGRPYREMLQQLYPRLRRVVSRVDFTVRGFTTEEAAEIIRKTPQLLSLEEMFMVAGTYPKESRDFAEVFETAVRLFPEDEIANHNAAATAIMQNKPEQADILLDRSSRQTAEYLNNRGVVYLLKGAYEQAEPLFREAEKRGLPEARHNLEELARKKISEGLD
ncbi:MAG: DUF3868 domain-containing protein [Tannerellaceae bacterium]|nr:DUF3868 domain-containing protein [Tannerellaceae bacterium]